MVILHYQESHAHNKCYALGFKTREKAIITGSSIIALAMMNYTSKHEVIQKKIQKFKNVGQLHEACYHVYDMYIDTCCMDFPEAYCVYSEWDAAFSYCSNYSDALSFAKSITARDYRKEDVEEGLEMLDRLNYNDVCYITKVLNVDE